MIEINYNVTKFFNIFIFFLTILGVVDCTTFNLCSLICIAFFIIPHDFFLCSSFQKPWIINHKFLCTCILCDTFFINPRVIIITSCCLSPNRLIIVYNCISIDNFIITLTIFGVMNFTICIDTCKLTQRTVLVKPCFKRQYSY